MLNFSKMRISRSVERPVAQGYSVTAEGQVLVAEEVNGEFGVRSSTGGAGEQFVGVAIEHPMSVFSAPNVEDVTVPAAAPYELKMSKVASAGTERVTINGTDLTLGSAANAGEYEIATVDGISVVTVNAAQAGLTGSVGYKYVPTTTEVRVFQSDPFPGSLAAEITGSVAVIEVGDIFTSEYDSTQDWSGTPVVTLGANGQFTIGGSGTVVDAVVIQKPTSADPFLGLRIK